MKPFFITIPHSGEKVPQEAYWLQDLDEVTLMCDVDRYVDQLYAPALQKLNIPFVKTDWHRYVIDLNRLENDVDQASVKGHKNPVGTFTNGLHWVRTTKGDILMTEPIELQQHNDLVKRYFYPFHEAITHQVQIIKKSGFHQIFHLDLHSMPSRGTSSHRDPGGVRADIVVSDYDGQSSNAQFKDLVINSYKEVGFSVAYNWPYKGGRLTQTYGQPENGHHTVQVELNRSLYMDEVTKQKNNSYGQTQTLLCKALELVYNNLNT